MAEGMSKEMQRVLRLIWKHPWSTPENCGCSYRTFVALERRGLVRVSTTFSSIAMPRTAEAVATSAGESVLRAGRRKRRAEPTQRRAENE